MKVEKDEFLIDCCHLYKSSAIAEMAPHVQVEFWSSLFTKMVFEWVYTVYIFLMQSYSVILWEYYHKSYIAKTMFFGNIFGYSMDLT